MSIEQPQQPIEDIHQQIEEQSQQQEQPPEQNQEEQEQETTQINLHENIGSNSEDIEGAEIEMDVEKDEDEEREERENERNTQFNYHLSNSYWVQPNPVPFVSTTTNSSNNCRAIVITFCVILIYFLIFLPIWWIVSLNKDKIFSLFHSSL